MEMRGDGLAVDGGDEHALVAALPRMRSVAAPSASRENARDPDGGLRALRLVGGKKNEQVGIVAAQPRHQLAIAQDHFSIGGASENARRSFRIVVHAGQVGPAQDRAIGIGWIGCGELDEFGLLRGRLVRNWRSRSTAAGSANCVAPRPATK